MFQLDLHTLKKYLESCGDKLMTRLKEILAKGFLDVVTMIKGDFERINLKFKEKPQTIIQFIQLMEYVGRESKESVE